MFRMQFTHFFTPVKIYMTTRFSLYSGNYMSATLHKENIVETSLLNKSFVSGSIKSFL